MCGEFISLGDSRPFVVCPWRPSLPDIDVLYISVLMAESEHLLDSPSLGNRIMLRCMCPLNPNQFHSEPGVSRIGFRAMEREWESKVSRFEFSICIGDRWQRPIRGCVIIKSIDIWNGNPQRRLQQPL